MMPYDDAVDALSYVVMDFKLSQQLGYTLKRKKSIKERIKCLLKKLVNGNI